MNYQENIEELENIVSKLENDDLPLDKATELFKRGAEIVKDCKKYLEEIKGAVYVVKQDLNTYTEEPMKVVEK